MRKHLKEDTKDLKINHQAIGMSHLLRVFSSKALKGSDFSDNKFAFCDAIVNHHCMNHCCKCWKDTNEKLHNEEVQVKRVIE